MKSPDADALSVPGCTEWNRTAGCEEQGCNGDGLDEDARLTHQRMDNEELLGNWRWTYQHYLASITEWNFTTHVHKKLPSRTIDFQNRHTALLSVTLLVYWSAFSPKSIGLCFVP